MHEETQNPYEAPREESVPQHGGDAGQPPPGSAFEAVNRRFFGLLGDNGGPLIILWGILALLSLPTQLLNVAAQGSMQAADFNAGFGLIILFYLLSIVVGALHFTSFRAMKMSDDEGGNITLMQAIDQTLSRILPTIATTVLYGIIVGIGTMLCLLPGIYAFIVLMPAPFICAVYGYGPIEALQTAKRWVHAHITLILILIAAGFLYFIVLGGLTMVITLVVFQADFGNPQSMTQMGYIPTTMIWLLSSALGYFAWLYAGSVYITIGRAEEKFLRRYDLFES